MSRAVCEAMLDEGTRCPSPALAGELFCGDHLGELQEAAESEQGREPAREQVEEADGRQLG